MAEVEKVAMGFKTVELKCSKGHNWQAEINDFITTPQGTLQLSSEKRWCLLCIEDHMKGRVGTVEVPGSD